METSLLRGLEGVAKASVTVDVDECRGWRLQTGMLGCRVVLVAVDELLELQLRLQPPGRIRPHQMAT